MKLNRLVLPVVTAAILAAPSAASAGALTHADPAGDVVSIDVTSNSQTTTPAPAQAIGDIVGTRLAYAGTTVRVKVRFRDLARRGTLMTVLVIKSGRGLRYVDLTARSGSYGGRLRVTTKDDTTVKCPGATHSIDYVGNAELITVPASCLGKPSWVRIGVGEVTTQNGFRTVFLDDARTNGDVSGSDPVLSPRIYR